MNVEPEIIMAYVDGELDLVTAKRIEKAMESDASLAGRIAAERVLKAKLSARFDPVADEEVPERLTALLANVDTSLAKRRETRKRRFEFGVAQWGVVAASLALGLFIGRASHMGPRGQIADRGGVLVARAELGKALDTQLASSQPADATTRIGLTFRDKAGTVCRTFEGQALSGIACRNGSEWQLRQTLSTAKDLQAYRQAGTDPIMALAGDMMASAAFDAQAERAALSGHWK